MDKAWPKIADAVMSPVLGPQLSQLASVAGRDNPSNNQGSSYNSGWYGYVDKDLRTLAGRSVAGRFRTRFCGNGDLTACRGDHRDSKRDERPPNREVRRRLHWIRLPL